MTVGDRIKQRREELNMSQDELAKKVGYKSRSSINKIELSRDLPLRKVAIMADALDTSPSALMGWDQTVIETENGDFIGREPVSKEKALVSAYRKAAPEIKLAVDKLLDI